ncbi:MAG: dual-specificity RNA methyltransferase RlmN [Planctomycetota bacterium]
MFLTGLSRAEMEELLAGLGEPPYRARQLFRWVFRNGARDYAAMTDLSLRLRERLAERIAVRSTHVLETPASDDGTRKLLVGLADGQRVECVLIPEADRVTGCISTQVGCGVGCIFCASGADGLVRNLEAAEIVEQVLWLRDLAGRRLTNLVVMGMGEPLHNVPALVRALRLLQDPEGLDLGARRITVSTAGPTRGCEEFLRAGLRVKLAISLHAARDELRRRLVPRGGTGSVAELALLAERWFEATGRDPTFEYVLLDGINDRDEDADALARLCGRHRNVNLIPMNPVPFARDLAAPPSHRIERFAARLRGAGVVVHVRRQRGDDVAAACGQLRLSRQEESTTEATDA